MSMHKKMVAGVIYQAKRGHVYDSTKRKYDCYCPVDYAHGCVMGDCWVCDERGEIHPGYCNSPVPVDVDSLGEVVGRMSAGEW